MTKKTTKNGGRSGTKPKKKNTMPVNTAKKKAKNPPTKGGNSIQQGTGDIIPVTIKHHRDSKGGHPHIIVDNIDDKHVSVGLSTKPTKGKGSKNYRMEKSPFDDGKQSYMRRQGTVASKNEYAGERKGTLTSKDYTQAKIYGNRAKQKYLDEKKNKKK